MWYLLIFIFTARMASLEGRTRVDITRKYESPLEIYVWFLKRLIKREEICPYVNTVGETGMQVARLGFFQGSSF